MANHFQNAVILYLAILTSLLLHTIQCTKTECQVHYGALKVPGRLVTFHDARKLCWTEFGGQLALFKTKDDLLAIYGFPLSTFHIVGAYRDPESPNEEFYWNDGEKVDPDLWVSDLNLNNYDYRCAYSVIKRVDLIGYKKYNETTGLIATRCDLATHVLCQWCLGDDPKGFKSGSPKQADCVCSLGAVLSTPDPRCRSHCRTVQGGNCQEMVECPSDICRKDEMAVLTQSCSDKRCFCATYRDCFREPGRGYCMIGCVRDGPRNCSQKACAPAWYGDDCDKGCSCEDFRGCSKKTETCNRHLPCLTVGYYGQYCDVTECPPGKWGQICENECRCEGGVQCKRYTGRCPGKCEDGWVDPCDKYVCPIGKWGYPCTKNCSCNGETCYRSNGLCPIRWRQDDCFKTTKWGINCDKDCLVSWCEQCYRYSGYHCKRCMYNLPMDPNGQCISKYCQDSSNPDMQPSMSNSYYLLLIAGTVLLVLATVSIGASFAYITKKKNERHLRSQMIAKEDIS